MQKVYAIIPTYNEAESITLLIEQIRSLGLDIHMVVVDDNSPDGTADIVEGLIDRDGLIQILRRPGKLGLGSAILDGMRKCLEDQDCNRIVTMDADLSHNPRDIPRMLEAGRDLDGMVQASRYVRGGKIVGWGFKRKLISRTATFLYRHLLGLKQREITTYFRVYSRRCAEVLVENVKGSNYEYAPESALVIKDHGFPVREVPITFTDRVRGESKLTSKVLRKSLLYLLKTFYERRMKPVPGSDRKG